MGLYDNTPREVLSMGSFDSADVLESLRDVELVRYIREHMTLSISESSDSRSEAAGVLDLIYAEFIRRGKERLYDAVREAVIRAAAPSQPQTADSPMQALTTEFTSDVADVVPVTD
jgi:hypothetical protein